MSLLKKEMSYFFNSAEESGAVKIGTLGNKFQISLNNPIHIPQSAVYATVHVPSSKIWNSSPNISAIIGNNKMYFSYLAVDYIIPIADGLYGVSELNALFVAFFTNNALPTDLFEMTANDSTQKVIFTFNYENIIIDFTQVDSCRDVLGFNSQIFGPFTPTPNIQSAPNEASFNRVVSYYIKSTLLSGGIPQNTTSNGIIAEVPITSPVGSLINYSPFNPIKADATELIGNTKQTFQFTLVDQLERDVSTAGEEWSLTIVLTYYMRV